MIEDKQIKEVKNGPELMSVRDIQLFIDFANFYQHFIRDFSRIIILLIFLLKTTKLLNSVYKAFKADNNKIVDSSSNRANKTAVN